MLDELGRLADEVLEDQISYDPTTCKLARGVKVLMTVIDELPWTRAYSRADFDSDLRDAEYELEQAERVEGEL